MAHIDIVHEEALNPYMVNTFLVDLHIDPISYKKALVKGFQPEKIDTHYSRVYIKLANGELIHYKDYK